jgi:hypothetical protein
VKRTVTKQADALLIVKSTTDQCLHFRKTGVTDFLKRDSMGNLQKGFFLY